MPKLLLLTAPLLAVLILASTREPLAAARPVDFDAATIAELNAAFDAGTLTAEKLVQACLARIKAYDAQGPKLHAVMALNPKALETARALDTERKARGRRSPLHGIPVVLKDNYNTADMPTTGGSLLLEGSVPPQDAVLVRRLRDAGAIILAKVNMSEFASAATHSSLGGQSLNPHDLTRSPSGSSGGTGVAIAAAYAPLGFGTDTGGSIRGPASVNGIAALKPTYGLLSRTGIIPLALTFDTGGPMARSVSDLAVTLGLLTGPDPADAATTKADGHRQTDYTTFLKADALKGARIGVARDFTGADADVDWVFEASLQAMRAQGATLVDVRYPKWLLAVREDWYQAIRYPEFAPQIAAYLSTLGPGYPKTLGEMIERSQKLTGTRADGAGPNPSRWSLFSRELASGSLDSYRYTSMRDHGLPMVRAIVEGILAADRLDAIVYPTSPGPASLIAAPPSGRPNEPSGTNLANLTGFPDLIVPAGFTGDGLPVTVSFMGPAFSEPKLFGLGYAFEQATHARRRPVHTPALPGETITVP